MSLLTELHQSAGQLRVASKPIEIFFKLAGHLQTKDADKIWPHVDGALIKIDISQTESAGRYGQRHYLRLFMIDFNENDGSPIQYIVHFPLSGENAFAARSILPKLQQVNFANTCIRVSVTRGDSSRSQSGLAAIFGNITPFRIISGCRVFGQDIRARYIEFNQITGAVNSIAARLDQSSPLDACQIKQMDQSQTPSLPRS